MRSLMAADAGGTDAPLDIDFEAENAACERASPEQRLARAVALFGEKLLFTSSFGAGSGVLLHLWSKVAPKMPVVFIDTGFLFEETIVYRDVLEAMLGLRIEVVKPAVSKSEFLCRHGNDIAARDPDACCAHNKVAPLEPLLRSARGWVSGLRRDQGPSRARTRIFLPTVEGPVKVHPLATMTSAEAADYLVRHGIPEHPLIARRYLSIGCAPCTRAVADGEDERGGRWAGTMKTECGLHTRFAPAKGAA